MFKTDTEFLVQTYSSGHSQLILQNHYVENSDVFCDEIIFEGVEYFNLPRRLNLFSLEIASDDEKVEFLKDKFDSNRFIEWNLFNLITKSHKYTILGLVYEIKEKIKVENK